MLKALKLLLISTFAIFLPVKSILLTVIILVLSDLVLGILAARKRKEKITSKGLKTTVVKLFVYEVAILLGFLAEQYLLGDTLSLIKIISAYIGLVEITSVVENLNAISGGSLLKNLVKKLNEKT